MALLRVQETARDGVQKRYNKERCIGINTLRFLDTVDKERVATLEELDSAKAENQRLTAEISRLEKEKEDEISRLEKEKQELQGQLAELPRLKQVEADYEILKEEKTLLDRHVDELRYHAPDLPRLLKVAGKFKVNQLVSRVLVIVCLFLFVVLLSKEWDLKMTEIALLQTQGKSMDGDSAISQARVVKHTTEKYESAAQGVQEAVPPKMTDSPPLLRVPGQ